MTGSGDGSIIYLNKVNRKPSLRVTFKKKLEGSEEMNHADTWGKHLRKRGLQKSRTKEGRRSDMFEEQKLGWLKMSDPREEPLEMSQEEA